MNEYCEGCPYWDDVNGCWQDLEPFTCHSQMMMDTSTKANMMNGSAKN